VDPFVFGIVIASIITVGRTTRALLLESSRRKTRRELGGDSPHDSARLEGLGEAMEGVMSRLERLEEERDFYRDLLDSPETDRKISPPGRAASDSGPG